MNNKKKIIQTVKSSPLYLFGGILVVAIVIFSLFPVMYAVLGAFKTNQELVSGAGLLPSEWHWENLVYAFNEMNFFRYSLNSLFVCAVCTVLAIFMSSMGGYCLSRYDFPGKQMFSAICHCLMFISLGSVVLFPIYRLMNDIGLTGNLIGLALVLTGGQTSNIVLVRGFVNNLPRELDESAYMDGAKPFQVYFRVMLPLLKPIISTVGLFTFRGTWNDYLTSMVFSIGASDLKTLTVATVALRYSANAAAEWHIMCAGALISMLPMLIVYLFANRQLISGLTAGAVKG